jgi:hypothetical protein
VRNFNSANTLTKVVKQKTLQRFQMLIELAKLASDLDIKGHSEEADALDDLINKMAQDDYHDDYHFGFGEDEMVDLLKPDPIRTIKELNRATTFALEDEDFKSSAKETFYNFFRIIKPFLTEGEIENHG